MLVLGTRVAASSPPDPTVGSGSQHWEAASCMLVSTLPATVKNTQCRVSKTLQNEILEGGQGTHRKAKEGRQRE